MFQNPFSFEGRIRRTEYGITYIIYLVSAGIINVVTTGGIRSGGGVGILGLLYIPLIWLVCAQATKRCHDRGNSGWYQLIPFYKLWLLFGDGEVGYNEYGEDPKNRAGGNNSMDTLIDQIGQDDNTEKGYNDRANNTSEQKVDYDDWK